jgi:hypothetical protein
VPEYRSGKSHRAVFRENSEQDARLLIRNVQTAALAVSQGKIHGIASGTAGRAASTVGAISFGARVVSKNGRYHLPFDWLTAEEEIEPGVAHRLVYVCPVIKTLTQWE